MGDDLSTGAKIGIGLIILCFLIAIVLSLLMVVKNITNSGANQMEGGLNQMMQSSYDDYDQTIVTGTKVKAALKMFNSEAVGIVVNTKYNGGDTVYCYGLVIEAGGKTATKTNVPGDTSKEYGDVYNYSGWTASSVYNTDGVTVAGGIPAGSNTWNLNTRPMDVSGTATFVRDSGKFSANLIKDKTGTIIGIYFELQA